MSDKAVTEAEFDSFVAGYGKPLQTSANRTYEPLLVTYIDPSTCRPYPDNVVAYKSELYDEEGKSFSPMRFKNHRLRAQEAG